MLRPPRGGGSGEAVAALEPRAAPSPPGHAGRVGQAGAGYPSRPRGSAEARPWRGCGCGTAPAAVSASAIEGAPVLGLCGPLPRSSRPVHPAEHGSLHQFRGRCSQPPLRAGLW